MIARQVECHQETATSNEFWVRLAHQGHDSYVMLVLNRKIKLNFRFRKTLLVCSVIVCVYVWLCVCKELLICTEINNSL